MSRKSGKAKNTWLGDLGPHSSGELWSSRWNNSWTYTRTSQFRWIVIIQMKQFLDLSFSDLSLSRSIPFTASSERIDAAPHVMTLRSSHYRSRQGLNALNAERFGKSWFPLTWHYFQMSWCGNDLLSRVCPRSLVTSNGPMGACNQRFSRSLVVFGIFHGDISWGYGDGSKPIVTIWLGEKKGT